ncbi:hypothetical protein NMY22_g4567 [Coprinellus aureogranulatus]|nr:hypothetical protein NMY22_g4567 [Coprinellus aureogranulatus]
MPSPIPFRSKSVAGFFDWVDSHSPPPPPNTPAVPSTRPPASVPHTAPPTQLGREARLQANEAAGIQPEDAQRLFDVMLHSLDSATKDTYAAGLKRFTQFCNSRGIPEEDRMPASAELISLFVALWAGKVAATTITNWINGIHFWHDVNGAPWLAGNCDMGP